MAIRTALDINYSLPMCAMLAVFSDSYRLRRGCDAMDGNRGGHGGVAAGDRERVAAVERLKGDGNDGTHETYGTLMGRMD